MKTMTSTTLTTAPVVSPTQTTLPTTPHDGFDANDAWDEDQKTFDADYSSEDAP